MRSLARSSIACAMPCEREGAPQGRQCLTLVDDRRCRTRHQSTRRSRTRRHPMLLMHGQALLTPSLMFARHLQWSSWMAAT